MGLPPGWAEELVNLGLVTENPDLLENKSTAERARMVQRLAQGATFNDDEATILAVLQASVAIGDVVQVIDGAGAWDPVNQTGLIALKPSRCRAQAVDPLRHKEQD